jgi:thiol:disulfide interchange protein DsbD
MVHVKSIFGIVLVIVAFYFLNTAFPGLSAFVKPSALFYGGMAALFLFGLLLGAVHREFSEPGAGVKIGKGLGIALVSFAGFGAVVGFSKPTGSLSWEKTAVEVAKARAEREKRPLLVDFTAAWCGACKELDKHTFAAKDVNAEASRFVAVKVDATVDDDPKVVATLERFGVKGLPTVVVFDSSGKEALRYTDFVPPDQFLRDIKKVD